MEGRGAPGAGAVWSAVLSVSVSASTAEGTESCGPHRAPGRRRVSHRFSAGGDPLRDGGGTNPHPESPSDGHARPRGNEPWERDPASHEFRTARSVESPSDPSGEQLG